MTDHDRESEQRAREVWEQVWSKALDRTVLFPKHRARAIKVLAAALEQADAAGYRRGVRQLWHDLLASTMDSHEADWVERIAAPLLFESTPLTPEEKHEEAVGEAWVASLLSAPEGGTHERQKD